MIRTAASYGLEAKGRIPLQTGVWVNDQKLGAVGVRISAGVTTHGLAFNVSPDLGAFTHIVPCGLADKKVTSLEREVSGSKVDAETVMEQLIAEFVSTFEMSADG
eukprot:TRINITY_DN16617_c0_g2_i1.p1 TRINITY_DN16617_c0_g2~~TRINITY_DN16617_c0_g2_i1.p1  ORF type:complete len:114 (-),score=14.71 TRINITY_DN16617_c0_g2_i1:80-394(-)